MIGRFEELQEDGSTEGERGTRKRKVNTLILVSVASHVPRDTPPIL